jgi:hypothetical protein
MPPTLCVDLPRIELGTVQCECTGIPLTYKPENRGRRITNCATGPRSDYNRYNNYNSYNLYILMEMMIHYEALNYSTKYIYLVKWSFVGTSLLPSTVVAIQSRYIATHDTFCGKQ